MLERDVKKRVKDLCKKYGAFPTMVVPTGYGRRGVSDFLICHKGRFIAVETKVGDARPTTLQVSYGREVELSGGIFLVINETNLDDLEKVLREK